MKIFRCISENVVVPKSNILFPGSLFAEDECGWWALVQLLSLQRSCLDVVTHFYGCLAHAVYLFIYPLKAFLQAFGISFLRDTTNLEMGLSSGGVKNPRILLSSI